MSYDNLHQALSVTVAALCNMTSSRYNEASQRDAAFFDALARVRELVGPELRLTTMTVTCAWCKTSMGDKEGNGSVGESHGICPTCAGAHLVGATSEFEYEVRSLPMRAPSILSEQTESGVRWVESILKEKPELRSGSAEVLLAPTIAGMTSCGINAMMVTCSYEPPDGACFYPSGPCRIGSERRKAGGPCTGTTRYAT